MSLRTFASVWINQWTFNTFNFPSNPVNAPVFNTMGSKPVCPSPICRLHGQPGSQSVEAPETSPLRLLPHPFSVPPIPRDCVLSDGYFTTYLRILARVRLCACLHMCDRNKSIVACMLQLASSSSSSSSTTFPSVDLLMLKNRRAVVIPGGCKDVAHLICTTSLPVSTLLIEILIK